MTIRMGAKIKYYGNDFQKSDFIKEIEHFIQFQKEKLILVRAVCFVLLHCGLLTFLKRSFGSSI